MRYRYCSILYLVIIIFYILRPSLPYIEYVINKSYIEKNLCVQKDNPENTCHGKCYLHKQINKQSEPSDAEKNDSRKIITDKKMDDHLKESLTIPAPFENEIILSCYSSVPGIVRFTSNIFVPPKF